MITIKNFNSIVFLLFFLLFFSVKINAQIKITGIVKNKLNTPIESANILVYDAKKNIIAYTHTKTSGTYQIELNIENSQKLITLSASSLGYKKKIDSINIINNLKQYKVNFLLKEKIEKLNEILLQPHEKIVKEGNTTTYKVKTFNKGTEQTIEDVLKNLPGIEVLKNGTIKAHGRLIDKLLIEGEDMFDKNYTILSKNLDANVLNEVEILDHFEDNPILAKVITSEKVAINLVLKEGYKNVWFGNISAGIGTEKRFKLASNIGLIKKKIKFFNFNNYNNLGTKALEQLETTTDYSTNAFLEKKTELKTTPIFDIKDNNNSIFKDGESTFNNAFINSLSFVTNLKPSLKIRGIGYFTSDIENQLSKSKTIFNINETPIVYTKKNNLEFDRKVAGGELELKYINGEKSFIKNTLIYNNKPKNTNTLLVFNDNNFSEILKEKEYSIYNHLHYTLLLNSKNLIHNYIYFGKNKINQNAIINSPSLNNLFIAPENNLINHLSKDELSVYGIKSSTLVNFKKLSTTMQMGYESLNENKANKFILLDYENNIEVDSLQNDLNFNQKKIYLKTDLKYSLSKKIELSGGLSIDYVNINTTFFKNDNLFFNPSLKINFKNLKIGFISFGYRKSYSTPQSYLFSTNYQLSNFQSLKRGTTNIKFPKSSNYSFYYSINNELHTKSLNIRARHINSNGRYSSSNQIDQDIIFSTSQFVDSGNISTIDISYTSYFKKINLSTNLGTSQNFSTTLTEANNTGFIKLRTYNSSYFISGRTYFKIPINFDFKFTLRQTKSKFNTLESTTSWKSLDFNAIYKLSKTCIASLDNRFYLLKDENFSFMNFKIDYTPEKSRLSYQFIINNLANKGLFSIDTLDEFVTYKSTTKLLPRYAYALVKYRF